MAHRSTTREELFLEDHGLNPNLEPVRDGVQSLNLRKDSTLLLNTEILKKRQIVIIMQQAERNAFCFPLESTLTLHLAAEWQ